MKEMKVFGRFLTLFLGVFLLALGCEDNPDTEHVDGYFNDRDMTPAIDTAMRLPERADPLTADQEALVIGPDGDVQLDSNGQILEVTLSGAEGAVVWSAAGGSGEIVTSSTTGATYRRLGPGDNVVTAVDGAGRGVSKVIKQPADAGDQYVVIGPEEEISLGTNGMIAGLTLERAQGGVTWSVSDTNRGAIVTSSTTGATYKRLAEGDNVVTATDSVDNSAFKVIKQP